MNKLSIEECNLLESRIIAICKQTKQDFVNIDINQITKNINFVYNSNYIIDDINYILGYLYEKQFNYKQEEYVL